MRKIVLPADEMNEFDLPRVCVVTGQTENVEFMEVKFSWYPRWVAVFILINLLIAAIIAFALTKKVKGKLPFTEESFKAWKLGQALMGVSTVVAIALFLVGIMMMAAENPAAGLVAWGLALAVPIGVWLKFARNRGPLVDRIADGRITLKLPSDAAVEMIEQHLVAGRQSPRAVAAGMKQTA